LDFEEIIKPKRFMFKKSVNYKKARIRLVKYPG